MAPKRTVLVTGCSDGSLGSALALALRDAGWRVFATARDPAKMGQLSREKAGEGIERLTLDVTSDESCEAAAAEVARLTGGNGGSGGSLDALVNNAGASYMMPVLDADVARVAKLFDLNAYSLIRATRAFAPLLMSAAAARQEELEGAGGHGKTPPPLVVNNTSGVALLGCGPPFQAPYNASKAAAASFTEALRLELAPLGVRVVNLVTGGVRSTFFRAEDCQALPEGSVYGVARDAVEPPLAGEQPGMDKMGSAEWAAQVARDLSRDKVPHMIYRGTKAGTARVVAHLPVGAGDPILRKMSGLDVLERRVREEGGLRGVVDRLAARKG